jgi:tetratricopeptide (TPR) repeat protein
MYCSSCGIENEHGSRFCKACGVRLDVGTGGTQSSDDQVRIGELVYQAYKFKEEGKTEEAILACQGAVALNHSNAAAHSLLASLYESTGDFGGAIREMEVVVKLLPNSEPDKQKLEDLKVQKIFDEPPQSSDGTFISKLASWQVYSPYIAAGLVFILMLGILTFFMGRAAKHVARVPSVPATSTIPSQGTPQVVSPLQTRPNSAAQDQQPPQVNQTGQNLGDHPLQNNPPTGKGIASIPIATPSAANPAGDKNADAASAPPKTLPGFSVVPSKSNPAITPVIEPVDNDQPKTPAPAPRVSRSTPTAPAPVITPVAAPAPEPAPTQKWTPQGNSEAQAKEYQRVGKYDEAIRAHRQALTEGEDAGRVYQEIGYCFQKLGQHESAIQSYKQAIQIYKDQLAHGRDQGDVERNIRSCEAGIKVNEAP